MPITNSAIAQLIQDAVDGWETFTTELTTWSVSVNPTESFTDPITTLPVVLKTPYQWQADYDALLDPVSGAIADALSAQEWAITAEDVLVPSGNLIDQYSALHYRAKALGHANAASASAGAAATSESNAQDSASTSQAWATFAEDVEVIPGFYSAKHHASLASNWSSKAEDSEVVPGKYSAKHWAAKSEGFVTDASDAATLAQAWATNPEGVPVTGLSYSAYHWSQVASNWQAQALVWRDEAEAQATNAANSASASSSASAISSQWADRAEDVEVTTGRYSAFHWSEKSSGHADSALSYMSAAEEASLTARDWADEAEDVEVTTGKYSAYHWAQKAADSAGVLTPPASDGWGYAMLDGVWTKSPWFDQLQAADLILGEGLAAETNLIRNYGNAGYLGLHGGNLATTGAAIRLYGGTHASAAGDIQFLNNNIVVGGYDATGETFSFLKNVGIGTDAPDSSLHIVGDTGSLVTPTTAAGQVLILEQGDANVNVAGLLKNTRTFNIQSIREGDTLPFGVWRWDAATGDMVIRNSTGSGTMSDRFRITNAGNIGINEASPDGLLHVSGSTGETPEIILDTPSGTVPTQWAMSNNKDTGRFTLTNKTGSRNPIKVTPDAVENLFRLGINNGDTVDINGKLGIGTASPGRQLHVYGTDGLRVERTAAGAFVELKDTGGTNQLRSTSNVLGIANSGGTYKLEVDTSAGTVKVNDLGTGALYTNAGVLTNTNPSDANLKQGIVNSGRGLFEVNDLRPVEFEWRDKEAHGDARHLGFIAQEVQGVLPELVAENSDGTLGIKSDQLVPVLVKAIQELSARLETLEAHLASIAGPGTPEVL